MGLHFMLLLSIYVLYSNVTYISCIMSCGNKIVSIVCFNENIPLKSLYEAVRKFLISNKDIFLQNLHFRQQTEKNHTGNKISTIINTSTHTACSTRKRSVHSLSDAYSAATSHDRYPHIPKNVTS